MEMQGSRTLAVTQQQAWDAIIDPQVLQACIPGCERMEQTAPGQYTAMIAVRIGPVAARFNGKVALSEIDAPQGCTITFDGQGGAAGFGRGSARVRITPKDGGCELAYDAQAQVGGKIAQVGQRLVDGVARAMTDDFFKRFDQEMQRRYPSPAPATAAAPVAAPAKAGIPGWAWVVGVVVVIALAWLVLHR